MVCGVERRRLPRRVDHHAGGELPRNIINKRSRLTFDAQTKGRTLEELDAVFGVPTHQQVSHGLKQVPFFFQRYIFRRDVHMRPLIDFDAARNNEDLDKVIA